MPSPTRDLTGEDARKLIDDILARTHDDFILHMSWKRIPQASGTEPAPHRPERSRGAGAGVKIEQHLSFHGTWTAQEILATGKGRNRQLEEIIMRSMGKK